MSDFWDEHQGIFGAKSAMDMMLQGRHLKKSSLRDLTDAGRVASGLQLPVTAGTRVAFRTNLGSLLSYPDVPDAGVVGTVVLVRAADGDMTHWNDRVMVAWDDGKFRPIQPEHLSLVTGARVANGMSVRVSNLGDISSMFAQSRTAENDLVHKATKDLWSMRQDGGDFVIERLFKTDGSPLKV